MTGLERESFSLTALGVRNRRRAVAESVSQFPKKDS